MQKCALLYADTSTAYNGIIGENYVCVAACIIVLH